MEYKERLSELILDKDSSCFRSFYYLFMELLESARERNDYAPIEEVPKIQGEIRILKQLLKDLNPTASKRVHYDGGFGG